MQHQLLLCMQVSGGNADSELRLVLIGKTGTGKSASGNTILGREEFISKPGSASITRECLKIKGRVDGRSVAVVDTPGLFDTELSNEESLREIVKCICMSSPGPHAFLIVIQVGRFTKEERDTVDLIMKAFGEEAEKYTMVLFTRGDDLEDNETIEEYIERGDQRLKNIVEKCGGRCHSFNNKKMTDRSQVTELLGKIESMVKENGGGCYTTEMYKKAEAAIEEEKKRIMKESPGCSEEDARKIAEVSNVFIKQLLILTAAARVAGGAGVGASIGAFGGPLGAGIGAAVGIVAV
ncbi:GTPase IMAP family member 7-like [Acipenser ruthenus]|uniref:GTPase IMAP family member 7-like n=1 Tax=Acipenser ruthenus TaxID=7906 RepID=UPI00274042BC|nr:GTPase IMAP family member 7-like [Acipenser ruthenus]XP_058872215.1 GTPase IMAP family member 7-like [Acipenser ruthenus]